MNNKDLQEARELNAKAKANMTSNGTSNVSLTSGTLNSGFTSGVTDYDLQETKDLNSKSKSGKSSQNK